MNTTPDIAEAIKIASDLAEEIAQRAIDALGAERSRLMVISMGEMASGENGLDAILKMREKVLALTGPEKIKHYDDFVAHVATVGALIVDAQHLKLTGGPQ